MRLYTFYQCLFLILTASIFAEEDKLSLDRKEVFAGPEWYYITRTKSGGSKQNGNMWGVRLGYHRLKRYGWYLGSEILYAKGSLKGKTGSDDRLRSDLTDFNADIRVGYTFQQKNGWQLAFTPFIGFGGLSEKNCFRHPSPIPIHCEVNFYFGEAGFMYWMHLLGNIEIGLNFIARIPYEPKCSVWHDPLHPAVKQRVKERMQYRVELPIGYRLFACGHGMVNIVPFYEIRHYGAHPNYPFDFFKTQFKNWGATFELQYRFRSP